MELTAAISHDGARFKFANMSMLPDFFLLPDVDINLRPAMVSKQLFFVVSFK